MDFWKSALAAAEKAAETAKDLGKKGLEVVEATAEEAGKKLGTISLHDSLGAGPSKAAPPSEAELAAYGCTPDFAEFVRTLNFSTFRDFPSEHLLPASSSDPGGSSAPAAAAAGAAAGAAVGPAYRLNPWQVRHATLVVQVLKEVNELRFVLCPKYMTDEHFWHVYFTLSRKYLPEQAYSWAPGQTLPFADKAAAASAAGGDAFSFSQLGDQLRQLSSKIQSATAAGASSLGQLGSKAVGSAAGAPAGGAAAPAAAAGGAAAAAAGGAAAASGGGGGGDGTISSLLEEDPDLEAYLQVAINSSAGGSQGGEEGEEGGSGEYDAVGDDDLDLDSYINELSAEVDAAEEEAAAAAAAAAGEGAGAQQGSKAAEGKKD